MFRRLPLLALVLLPAAVAAPVPRGARVEFGSNGLVTRADLEKVKFDSQPLKEGERGGDALAQEGGPAKYDLAVHMPWTKFREGEAIPAYFVLKNQRNVRLGLDAQLELFGPMSVTWNSCDISLRDQKTGKPAGGVRLAGWKCGGGALVDVPANGFYAVKGDLATLGGEVLPAGDYEVDWRYARLRSAPVTFTVLKAETKPAVPATRPGVHFLHLAPETARALRPAKLGEAFVWRETRLENSDAAAMSAALAVGHEGVYIPDIHTIPAADKLIEASIEWKPYRDGDHVAVTLRAMPPYQEIRFADFPQLHLQLQFASGGPRHWPVGLHEPDAKQSAGDTLLVTPLTIEARLPADWREQNGITGIARVAVLVTAKPIALPLRGGRDQQQVEKVVQDVKLNDSKRPPIWSGLVRTEFVELQFPPRVLPPQQEGIGSSDW